VRVGAGGEFAPLIQADGRDSVSGGTRRSPSSALLGVSIRACVIALLGLLFGSAVARAQPVSLVALAGAVYTPETSLTLHKHQATIQPMNGPTFQAGLEVGNYFNNQFTFVYSHLTGTAIPVEMPDVPANVDGEVFA